MKGNNSYISETLFGLFHGKAQYNQKINVARQVTHQTQQQMASVVNKKQKLIKCCHIWFGLYKQALADGKKPVVPLVNLEEDAPVKTGLEKRKEQTSDFQAPPPAKKLLAAHMDPDQAAAKATISALLEKKKAKSEIGSKGSLVSGAKTSRQKVGTEASAPRGGQPKKQIQKVTSPLAQDKEVRKLKFLEEEHQLYAADLQATTEKSVVIHAQDRAAKVL